MEFNNLYSKTELNQIFNSDLKNGMLNHAYLFCGQDELFLKYLAKEVAKQILTNNSPSKKDIISNKIEKDIHCDVVTYPKENEKNIVVEDVNNIVSSAYVYPLESDKKIFILNNFDLATTQAQNKLLKTLEEPPVCSLFILTSTNPSNILNTIKSRTKLINVPLLSNFDVKNFVLSNSSLKENESLTYVSSAQGNLTKAYKIINDEDFVKMKNLALDVVLNLKDSGSVIIYASKILSFKNRIDEILDEIALVLLDLLYVKSNLTNKVLNKNYVAEFENSDFSIKAIKIVYEQILKTQEKIKSNCNVNIVIDNFLVTMLEVKHKWK